MKRKNNTVTPEAGTLKQTNHSERNVLKQLAAKLIALTLIPSIAFMNMSFMPDSLPEGMNKSDTIDRIEKADSCCVTPGQKSVTAKNRKMVKLVMPSAEMIRKSDSEAYANLINSVKENELNILHHMFVMSDTEMHDRFRSETSVQPDNLLNEVAADEQISSQFAAENIVTVSPVSILKADEMVDASFAVETTGLQISADGNESSDREINRQFLVENIRISLPSRARFANTDVEMDMLRNQDTHTASIVKPFVSSYSK
jgi:hypothetical protein